MPTLHVTVASATFTLAATIGLYFSANILPRYIRAYRRARKQSSERVLSEGLHREIMVVETMRLLVHLTSMSAGIWSFFIDPTPAIFTDRNHAWFEVYVLCVLVSANVAVTINTLIVRHGYLRRRGETKPPLSRDAVAGILRRERATSRESKRQAAEGDRQTREGERQTREGVRQTIEGERLRDLEEATRRSTTQEQRKPKKQTAE
jgi:hypothetical protein